MAYIRISSSYRKGWAMNSSQPPYKQNVTDYLKSSDTASYRQNQNANTLIWGR